MMRELFRKRMGLAVLAGLGLSAAAATSANAALLTLELRPTSSTTLVSPAAGATVTFNVFAVVQNGDANSANDGFQLTNNALTSIDSGALGDLSPVTFNTSVLDAGTSAAGTQMNRDANPDQEVGGADPAVVTGWITLSTGTTPKFGPGGAGNPEFLLGTTTWTYTGGTGSTNVNLEMRVRTSGNTIQQQTVKYNSDGVAHSERGDNANIAVGSPVTVNVVPEPAALGLLGLGALAGLRRRRA